MLWLARLSSLISDRLLFAIRYLPRISHVLRTEGLSVLVEKLRRRLRSTPLTVARRPWLIALRPPYAPLSFQFSDRPAVSVIIPVCNNYRHTYHCLAALHAHPGVRPLEIVVVDDCSTDETRDQLARFETVRVVRNAHNLGFVRTCNHGAEVARGTFLVFLNNDTQVQPGWLDALVGTFDARPDAGLVGSRLIYPDGRQQEAGGLLSADGSAWNYGHLDDPYKPQYGYLREADYCSGGALAIPRVLFEQLGGFDPQFAPAYYEDADLAMRVRAAGYKVYYQPQAWVVHFEGVSAGTDRGAVVTGMKRFQEINREKFLARWGERLRTGGRAARIWIVPRSAGSDAGPLWWTTTW